MHPFFVALFVALFIPLVILVMSHNFFNLFWEPHHPQESFEVTLKNFRVKFIADLK